MSGLFLSNQPTGFDPVSSLSFVRADRSLPINWPGLIASLVRSDAPQLWAPAFCPERQTGLLIQGRVRFTPQQWEEASHLPLQGGFAARMLLDAWLLQGAYGLESRLNGAAAVVAWENKSQELHLWTDRMGVVPIYQPDSALKPWAITSHPDTLAEWLSAQGTPPDLDIDSLAESICIGAVTPPYSFYRQIRLLKPASHYVWKIDGTQVRLQSCAPYWQPAAIDYSLKEEAAIDGLANALQRACLRQPPGKSVLLLSGGADSRGLLFAHEHPAKIQCLTFCDSENSEVSRAREVAQLAGADHEIMYRDPEHYAKGAENTVRITGGMGSIKDAHFAGFQSILENQHADSMLTGCYADYLYKGLSYNRCAYRFFGRDLPLEKPGPYHPDYYQPHRWISDQFRPTLARRSEERYGLNPAAHYEKNPETIADQRVRPLTREADSMGRLYLLATQPWDPVMVDNDLLEFYGRLSPAMKINSRIFAPAVLKLLPATGKNIPNNNPGQFALGLPFWRQWTAGVTWLIKGALQRKLFPHQPQLGTASSWPNFSHFIANSQLIPLLWESWDKTHANLIGQILGNNPAEKSLSIWANDPDLFLRVLTLKLWLQQRKF